MQSGDGRNDPAPSRGGRQDHGWVTSLAAGYLILLYVAGCAVIGVSVYVRRREIPLVQNYFPTAVPSQTPAPHLLAHQLASMAGVLFDNFDNNQYQWNAYYTDSKVEVVGAGCSCSPM